MGGMKQFVDLEDDYEGYFCVVDQDGIRVSEERVGVGENIRRLGGVYLGVGVDGEKGRLFME